MPVCEPEPCSADTPCLFVPLCRDKGISSVGNRGGLKPLEATSYITAAGLKEALRSKRLEPGHKLET